MVKKHEQRKYYSQLEMENNKFHRKSSTHLNDWLNVDIFIEVHKPVPRNTQNKNKNSY